MIIKNSSGIVPSIDITIGEVEVNYSSIQQIKLCLKENEHDMLVMRMAGIPVKALTDYIKAPVRFLMTRGSSQRHEFVGEIAQIIPESVTRDGAVNNSPIQTGWIYCMGASYRMRGATSKAWGNKTLIDISDELSKKYGFSLDVPDDKFVHVNTTQLDTSDWKFLTSLCDTSGYSLTTHGTHMHIWDPYKSTGRRNSYHRVYTIKKTAGDPNPTPGAILSFTGSFESYTPSTFFTSVLDAQGSITNIDTDQLNESFGLGREFKSPYPSRVAVTAMSTEEAKVRLKAISRNVAPFKAKLEVIGLVGVVPGGLIEIDKYEAGIDGLWYVESVEHTIGQSGMLTHIDVVRDSTNDDPPIIYNTQRYKEPALSQYINNSWVSSRRRLNVYK